MKHFNYINLFVDAVQLRINSLAAEIVLCDAQLKLFGGVPGTKEIDYKQLLLIRNIKATLHNALTEYNKTMQSFNRESAPLKKAISCHLFTLQQDKMQILLQELFGQQSALTTIVGNDYQKYTKDEDVPADIHLRMITLIFPYEFLVELLSSAEFVHNLAAVVLQYTAKNHVRHIRSLFNYIRKFKSLKTLSSSFQFFTANHTMFFALAEHLLTLFVRTKMLHENWQPLRNFTTAEKSRLITDQGSAKLKLNEKIVNYLISQKIEKKELPSEDVRPICVTAPDLEFDENEIIEIPALLHVVLELRKMPLQPSPSAVLYVLSNALGLMTSAVSIDKQQIGADEIFQFFVYCLATAKVWCLPGIASFAEKFVDEALLETKYQYLITQLNCALEFIEVRKLPVKPLLVLPSVPLTKEVLVNVTPADDEDKIILRRFAVYAYPTYSKKTKSVFPAMLRYTGDLLDVAIVRRYKVNVSASFMGDIESVASLEGTIFPVTVQYIERNRMIKVNGGDMVQSDQLVSVFSALEKMLNGFVRKPALIKLDQVFTAVRETWKISKNISSVTIIIAEFQRALVILGKLPCEFPIDGVLNYETLKALEGMIGKGFELSPKTFEYVINLAKEM
jgi:hypothetical protein